MMLSRKVFLVFAALFAATACLGGVVLLSVRDMQRASDQMAAIQQFQLGLQRLEPFHRGAGVRVTEAQRREFGRRWAAAKAAADAVAAADPGLPADLRRRLEAVSEQLLFFRNGVGEVLDRQETDRRLHLENHALVEDLAGEILALPDSQRVVRATTMSQLETAWARAYHDRAPAAVEALRRVLADARGSWASAPAVEELGRFVANSERSFLNHLAARERETMLAATAARLHQVADESIGAVREARRTGHRHLARAAMATVAVALVLTLGLWLGCTRYLQRFLSASRTLIDQVRSGEYRVAVPGAPADEFGDLTRFLAEVSAELGDTVERLQNSQLRYRGLVEELADWVWETDAAGRFTYCSPASQALLGLAPEVVAERTLEAVLGGSRTLPAWAQDGFLSRWRRPDGGERVLESRWGARPEAPQEGLRGITRDVTDRVHAEREQQRLQEQLVQAQKMEAVGTLSGGVAHDFNNLLQSIGGYAELLLHQHRDAPALADPLGKIVAATGRAARLTEQLLVFGRRSPGRPRPVDLNGEVEQAVELLRRTVPRMIGIRVEPGADLPAALADPVQLEQVVVNLALNARDAMPRGGELVLRTERVRVGSGGLAPHPDLVPGEYLCLQVSDTGEGMSAAVRARVFEPFFTTKEVGKGTGLGLAMVYGIARSHGGAVGCRSEVGRGTSFSVYLPAAVHQGVPDADALRPEGERPEPAGPGGTVLVVDDEPWVRELGAQILGGGGYTVLEAESGEAALERYRERPGGVDLVVLDLNMPGMGGEECLRRLLRADPRARVLIATGHLAAPGDGAGGLGRARGWLRKPYRSRHLLAEVRRALNG